mgnify:CR=1 FL=1
MSESASCKRGVLARAAGYRIEYCTCGHIHVSVGPITMHMEPSACESFTQVLNEAMETFAENEAKGTPPTLRLLPSAEHPPGVADGSMA